MSFRRNINSHDAWRILVRENAGLLMELPREALANEKIFRDYVTHGTHDGVKLEPSVFELSSKSLDELWIFINHKAQFDMDAILFEDFNEALRRVIR